MYKNIDSSSISSLNPYSVKDNEIGISWENISISDISSSGVLKINDGDEEIELTFQEIKRIKELLKEKFPEDYI